MIQNIVIEQNITEILKGILNIPVNEFAEKFFSCSKLNSINVEIDDTDENNILETIYIIDIDYRIEISILMGVKTQDLDYKYSIKIIKSEKYKILDYEIKSDYIKSLIVLLERKIEEANDFMIMESFDYIKNNF